MSRKLPNNYTRRTCGASQLFRKHFSVRHEKFIQFSDRLSAQFARRMSLHCQRERNVSLGNTNHRHRNQTRDMKSAEKCRKTVKVSLCNRREWIYVKISTSLFGKFVKLCQKNLITLEKIAERVKIPRKEPSM